MTDGTRRTAIVVGAGAWGLPTAAQLALRGHEVTLIDRYGVANPLSSSPGPTRVWRHADTTPVLCRLGLRSVGAMDRLAARSKVEVYRRVGVLWRDHDPFRLLTRWRLPTSGNGFRASCQTSAPRSGRHWADVCSRPPR